MKRSVILTDRLGPDILSAFWTKGQVLHRERAHLKVPGFSIVLNVLLTRKLPTFLSRLNEISGGCEKNAPVSGSFCTFSRHFFLGTLSHWRQLRNDVYDDCDVIVPVQGRTDYCLPTLLTVLTPPPEGLAFAFRRSCLL